MVKRNTNIELLRCVLMFLIVARHSFHCGAFSDVTSWWTPLFEGVIAWHVDAFIGISGWFGVRFSWRKVARLVGIMAWYSALSVGYLLFFDRANFSLRNIGITGGWFGNTYLMFLFVVPFVNAAIERLMEVPKNETTAGARRKLWTVWGALAGAYALTWLPGHLFLPFNPSGVNGQSLFLFFFIYLTVRLMRLTGLSERIGKLALFTGGGVFVVVMIILGSIAMLYRWKVGLPIQGRNLSAWSGYDAPHVWLFAICIVAFFAQCVRVPEWLSRVVAIISPSMFGVYLMHTTTSFGGFLYMLPEKWLSNATSLHPSIIILLSTIVCFVFCCLCDLVRRAMVSVLTRKVGC